MISIFESWILFGGLLSAVLAGGLLMRRPRSTNSHYLIGMLLCTSLWQSIGGTYGALRNLQQIGLANQLHLITIVTYCWTGPLLYFYFREALARPEPWQRTGWLHFLLGALIASFLLIYWLVLPEHMSDPEFLFSPQMLIVGYSAALSVALYGLLVMWMLLRLLRTPGKRSFEFSLVTGALLLPICIMSLAELLGARDLLNALVTVLIIALYWLGQRHPALLLVLKDEAERARYAQSQLESLPLDLLTRDLLLLMQVERLYLNEELNLGKLARHLKINSHQVSEFLNSKFGKNFYTFVNGYRVQDARKLLVENLDLSVTAIGFEVGFNSNSAFYEAFKKETDLSPGMYRKKHRATTKGNEHSIQVN